MTFSEKIRDIPKKKLARQYEITKDYLALWTATYYGQRY